MKSDTQEMQGIYLTWVRLQDLPADLFDAAQVAGSLILPRLA
jgi:hypothetical protein